MIVDNTVCMPTSQLKLDLTPPNIDPHSHELHFTNNIAFLSSCHSVAIQCSRKENFFSFLKRFLTTVSWLEFSRSKSWQNDRGVVRRVAHRMVNDGKYLPDSCVMYCTYMYVCKLMCLQSLYISCSASKGADHFFHLWLTLVYQFAWHCRIAI